MMHTNWILSQMTVIFQSLTDRSQLNGGMTRKRQCAIPNNLSGIEFSIDSLIICPTSVRNEEIIVQIAVKHRKLTCRC